MQQTRATHLPASHITEYSQRSQQNTGFESVLKVAVERCTSRPEFIRCTVRRFPERTGCVAMQQSARALVFIWLVGGFQWGVVGRKELARVSTGLGQNESDAVQ